MFQAVAAKGHGGRGAIRAWWGSFVKRFNLKSIRNERLRGGTAEGSLHSKPNTHVPHLWHDQVNNNNNRPKIIDYLFLPVGPLTLPSLTIRTY